MNRIRLHILRWLAAHTAARDERAATRTLNRLRDHTKTERRSARRARHYALARRLYVAWLDEANPGYRRTGQQLLLLPATTRVNVERIRTIIGGIRLERSAA